MVKFEEYKKMPTTYQAVPENILLRTRYPKFVYHAKLLYGDIAELIIENVLMNGAEILSRVVSKVAERLDSEGGQPSEVKPDEALVYQKCIELITGHYLKRVPMQTDPELSAEDRERSNEIKEEEAFVVPPGILQGTFASSW